MSYDWIDITVPLSEDLPPWPGDPRFERTEHTAVEKHGHTLSSVSMSLHAGTHVDAPAHYLKHGATIDEMPFDDAIGPCVVLDLPKLTRIEREDLERFRLPEAERVLLKTSNSRRNLLESKTFHDDFVHLSPGAAAYLAETHTRCVGIDYFSIGGMEDGARVHEILLSSGVWIIGALDLRGVSPGSYEMVCLPLRIRGAEAAPARVLLRPTESGDENDFLDDAVEWASKTG
jgi:arylformamidase